MPRALQLLALLLVAAAIAGAGLWPFDLARANRIAWLEPGLRFDDGGIAWSSVPLRWDTTSVAVDVTFRAADPRAPGERGFVALLDADGRSLMGIRQEGADLVVWDLVTNPGGDQWYHDSVLANAVRAGAVQRLVVVSDGPGPEFWLDGVPVRPSEGFRVPFVKPGEAFGGRLVVGATPPYRQPWRGDLLALTVYDRPTGSAIAAGTVTAAGAVPNEGVIAAYRFDGPPRVRIEDVAGGRFPLEVPDGFRAPERRILALPARRDLTEGWFVADVVVNLLGFVPLGFLLSVLVGRRRPAVVVVVLATTVGALASLGIELAQVAMVTRNSSLVDLVLNTAGAALGAGLAGVWRRRRA